MICDKLLARRRSKRNKTSKQNVSARVFLQGDLRRGGRNDQDPVVRRHSGLVDGVLPGRARGERDIHSHSGAQDASSASKSPYQGSGSRGIERQPGAPDVSCPSQSPYPRKRPRGIGFHSLALIKRVIAGRGFV